MVILIDCSTCLLLTILLDGSTWRHYLKVLPAWRFCLKALFGDFTLRFCLTILLEGLNIVTFGLDNADLKNFNKEYLLNLNPWFRSIGYEMKVDVFDRNDKESYEKYYCKTMINNKLYRGFFEMKGIKKPYHFLLNGNFIEENKQKKQLNELFTVFLNEDRVYSISFDFYLPKEEVTKSVRAIGAI